MPGFILTKIAFAAIIADKKARNEANNFGLKTVYTSTLLKTAENQGLIESYLQLTCQLKVLSEEDKTLLNFESLVKLKS
jgi:predicted nucleic acid-binding protein